MTENYSIGNYRRDIQKLDDREKCWRTKFQVMRTRLRELDLIVRKHNTDLKVNSLARPRIITRTVSLQTDAVIIYPKKLNFVGNMNYEF